MKKLTSQSSASKRNERFKKLLRADTSLMDEVADARVCNEIAANLYDLRIKAKITQKELAEKLGVQQSNISRWEQAGYQGYKVKMLAKLVRNLGGRLNISIISNPTTVISYVAYQRTDHNRIEAIYPDGARITKESFSTHNLFALEMRGEGAKNATANV